jgi:hypothetical protein
MAALLDRTVRALHRKLSTETDESLAKTMQFPRERLAPHGR